MPFINWPSFLYPASWLKLAVESGSEWQDLFCSVHCIRYFAVHHLNSLSCAYRPNLLHSRGFRRMNSVGEGANVVCIVTDV
jgi:hypothetical protein